MNISNNNALYFCDKIICADVIEGLRQIPDRTVHLIVTSPPFNVGIDYENHSDSLPHIEYLEWMKAVWNECYRVLVKGGRICINVDATVNIEGEAENRKERMHPLHVDFTNQLRDLGYLYFAEICWTKQNSPGKATAWGSYCLCSSPHIRRNTEYIVMAAKESLVLEGDHQKCDLSKEEFHEWTLSEWKIKPETGRKGHPVPYPRELVKRCVKLLSYVGNVVLDPFNGSGTTTETALRLGRKYIGIDNSEFYCKKARMALNRPLSELHMEGGYKFKPSPVGCAEARQQKKANYDNIWRGEVEK